jgi:limonene-1,2-epoxide hydrolase
VARIEDIAEAFSRHDFAATYEHLTDDVRWDVVGDRQIAGRAAVIATCEESAAFLREVTTRFVAFRIVVGTNCVVTDSTAEYADADGEVSTVASCDLYAFAGGKLTGIRSYTVELG